MSKRNQQKRVRSRLVHISLLLLLAQILFLAMPSVASAHSLESEALGVDNAQVFSRTLVYGAESTYNITKQLSVMGISDTRTSSYKAYPIRISGKSIGASALFINGMYYVPLRSFMTSVSGISVNYNSSTKTATVSGSGLSMTLSDKSYVIYANDRALFEMSPARLMSDGRMYIPASTAAKALSLSFSLTNGELRFSGTAKAIKHASSFYEEDAVYWLSRIISAESRGEPLLGQIAVGNVIMNRVRSKDFPNTIWGVIFDRKYGVQFSPIANGTIYNDPAFTSILAAKICLEGFSLSDDALYFLAPKYASSSWISKNKNYEFTIENHEFYS